MHLLRIHLFIEVLKKWLSTILVSVLDSFEVLADVFKLIFIEFMILRTNQIIGGEFVNDKDIAFFSCNDIERTTEV
jgi:hypothetical protein